MNISGAICHINQPHSASERAEGGTDDPAHRNQTPKVIPQSPVRRVKRITRPDTAPVETEIEHSSPIIPTPKRPHPPRFVIQQTQRGDTGERRKEEHGEELINEGGDED